ncbi:hypothetical protein [Nonomuraea sediminis]|uniref:hypothetical protein n=1 Tax=Nonomuraea sediminis TaxID=2835864 RepID=UPI001BDC654F|nr:hypothetical protein [Nonomuraea sediminis]
MIILGLILLLLGWLTGLSILYTIGVVILIVGLVFLVMGSVGRPAFGRRYWF